MIGFLQNSSQKKLIALVQMIGIVSLVISIVFYFYLVLNFVLIE